VNAALSTKPFFLFQNNNGFSHTLSKGSYSWVMPTTTDYGMSYLTSFYDAGMPLTNDQTVGASYKGFNDSLAAWGAGRVMGQQCGQTWLHTFSEINGLYNSGKQLPALQLVTWNDYEEGSEIESGISNCLSVSATVSGNTLNWSTTGNASTLNRYVAYISTDGQNLMALANANASTNSLNLCSYPIPNGNYILYVQAVGKPSLSNHISGQVRFTANCGVSSTLTIGATPSAMTMDSAGSGQITVTAAPQSNASTIAIALTCAGLPNTLTCSFAPASITPGTTAVSSILTISSVSTASMDHRASRGGPVLATWLLSSGLFGIVFVGGGLRRRAFPLLGAVALTVMIGCCISCGGKISTPVPSGVTPGSYIVTINGSSQSVQTSTTVTVTVR
jgi:hypothetical protein